MKTLNATKFKEQCLSVLDELSNEGVLITKHGRPVAQLLPVAASYERLVGSMKGKIGARDDLLSTGIEWNAAAQK